MSSFVAMVSFMRREKDQIGTLKFIAIGVMCMLVMDHFVFGGKRSYIEDLKTPDVQTIETPKNPPVRVKPPEGQAFFEAPPLPIPEAPIVEEDVIPEPEKPVESIPKLDKKSFIPHGAPKIAIIIDDLGMDVKHSREVLALPAPITLAFLPYGTKTKEFAAIGKRNGHTLIIHVPMQASDGSKNIGPGGLKAGMSDPDFKAAFDTMLASFSGYEGINNHMGSALTQDKEAMDRLMKILSSKGLFFVDSKTSPRSVAAYEAQEEGIPFAERDVFLDHEDSASFVARALRQTEERALKHGYAIAIGHPKANTIAGLKAWLPTLAAKGIEVVSVKDLLVRKGAIVPTPVVPETKISPAAGNDPAPKVSGILPAQPEILLHPLPQELPEPLFYTP